MFRLVQRFIAGPLLILAYASPCAAEAAPCANPTIEIHCDHVDIVAKAGELETPLAIYQFVRNEVEYEVYYGSKKGALGTLWSRKGNDYDQASLLIALLRAQGYSARYAIGMVNVDIDQLQAWAGFRHDDSDGTAIRFFKQQYCLDKNALNSDGQGPCNETPKRFNIVQQGILMERAWAEVQLPRIHRGVDAGVAGLVWIPLDPSWKQKAYPSPAEMIEPPIGDERNAGGCTGKVCLDYDAFYSGVDSRLATEAWADELRGWLAENHPGASLDDVVYDGPIIADRGEVLPSSLPFYPEPEDLDGAPATVGTVTAFDLDELDDGVERRFELTVRLWSLECCRPQCCGLSPYYIEDHVSQSFATASLVGKRLTLSYEPDASSQALVLSNGGYLSGWNGTGNYESVFDYCTQNSNPQCDIVAVLRLDGVEVARATSTQRLGDPPWNLSIYRHLTPGPFFSPAVKSVTYHPVPGTFTSLAYDLNHTRGEVVHERIQAFLSAEDPFPLVLEGESEDLNGNGVPGETLIDQGAEGIEACPDYAAPDAMTTCDISVSAQFNVNDALVGELLHLAVLRYFQRAREEIDALARLDRFVLGGGPFVGIATAGVHFTYLFERPLAVDPATPTIDIRGMNFFVDSIDGASSQLNPNREGRLLLHMLSGLEHEVWEELLDMEFVSTIKGIQLVRERFPAQPVLSTDGMDWETEVKPKIAAQVLDPIPADVYEEELVPQGNNGRVISPIASLANDAGGTPVVVFFKEDDLGGGEFDFQASILYDGQMINGGVGAWAFSPVFVPGLNIAEGSCASPWACFAQEANLNFGDDGIDVYDSTWSPALISEASAGDPVSVVTGNLHHEEVDFRIPGDGPDFFFQRSYNSRIEEAGALGFGWQHSYDLRVQPVQDEQVFAYLPSNLGNFAAAYNVEGSLDATRSDTVPPPGLPAESVGWSGGGSGPNEYVEWAPLPATLTGGIESIELELLHKGVWELHFPTSGQPKKAYFNGSSHEYDSIPIEDAQGEPFTDLSAPFRIELHFFGGTGDSLTMARLRVRYRGSPVERVEVLPINVAGFADPTALETDRDPSTCTATTGASGVVDYDPQVPLGAFGYELLLATGTAADRSGIRLESPSGGNELIHTETIGDGARWHFMRGDVNSFADKITFDQDLIDSNPPLGELCDLQYRLLVLPPREMDVVLEDGSRVRFKEVAASGGGTEWDRYPGVRGRLVEDAQGFEFTRANGTIYRFDEPIGERHYLTRLIDPQGRSLLLDYDTAGRLESVADDTQVQTSAGMIFPSLDFSYDSNDYLASVTDWTGRSWEFDVQNDHLVEARDPLEVANGWIGTRYEYDHYGDSRNPDLEHNLTRVVFPKDTDGDGGDHWVAFTYFGSDRVSSHVDALGNRQYFLFNLAQLSSETIDPRGHRTIYRHDRLGNLVQRIDPDGASWRWEFDDDRNVISETDPLGFVREFRSFDDRGNPAEIEDRDGRVTSYSYDALTSAPASTVDKRGILSETLFEDGQPTTTSVQLGGNPTTLRTNIYDPATHRLERTVEPFGDGSGRRRVTRFFYYPGNRDVEWVEVWEDADGDADSDGDPIEESTDAKLIATHLIYDDLGRVVEERTLRRDDADGQRTTELVTTRIFNLRGELERVNLPDGTAIVSGYDPNGNREFQFVEETLLKPSPNGESVAIHHRVDFEYDAIDRLIRMTNALGQTTSFGHDAMGNVVSTTDPLGHTSQVEYDPMARPARTIDANGATWTTLYDFLGRPVEETDPTGVATRRTYDEVGRLMTLQSGTNQPATRTVVYGVPSPTSYREEISDPNSKLTTFDFDELGRIARTTDAENGESDLGYDFFGNLISFSDPTDAESTFVFDGLGRQVRAHYAWASEAIETVFDEAGNPLRTTKADGCRIDRTYDRLGRLLSRHSDEASCDGVVDDRFGYDAVGNLVAAKNPHVGLIREYDAVGRLTTEIDDRFRSAVKYVYDDAGRVRSKVYPDGNVVQISYDGAGRTVGISDFLGDTIRYAYDSAGRRIQIRSSISGFEQRLEYDADGQLAEIMTNRSGGTVASSFAYPLHDDVGNRLQVNGPAGTTLYDYDGLYRLDLENRPGSGAVHYGYDPAGNRLRSGAQDGAGGWVDPYVDYQYSATLNHRVTAAVHSSAGSLESFDAYDARGNPKSWTHAGSQRTLVWDALDRLVEVSGGFSATYFYDPFGRRIEKVEAGASTLYQHGGLDVVAEYDATYVLQATYIFGPGIDEPLKLRRGSTNLGFHPDGLGSIAAISSLDGGVDAASYTYDAFGVDLGTAGSEALFTFTGRERDATGLYYYRARYYLPTVGRFLTPDPIGLLGGINPYAYVGSNPVNLRDPFGLAAAPGAPSYTTASPLTSSSQGALGLAQGFANTFVQGSVQLAQVFDPVFQTAMLPFAAAEALDREFGTSLDALTAGTVAACLPCAAGLQTGRTGVSALAAVGRFGRTGSLVAQGSLGAARLPFSGRLLRVGGKADPAAEALASRIGGQARVRFEFDPTGREFDAISDLFIGQAASGRTLGSRFRGQARATFEAAFQTDRTPLFQFQHGPSRDVQRLLDRLADEFGMTPTILR